MNICKKMIVAGKVALGALIVLNLTACHEDVTLFGDQGEVIGKGILEINAVSTASANFDINGKNYAGSWEISNAYDPKDEMRYRLMGSRSYEVYAMGNTPDKLKLVHAKLFAQDGTAMICNFRYHSKPESGDCIVDGKPMKLTIHID